MSYPNSATGVVFSSSRPTDGVMPGKEGATTEKTEKSYATSTVTAVGTAPNSAKGSPAASIHDAEKAESTLEDDLAGYVVPALEKGVKGARLSQSQWIRFRVWYNPYRIVSTLLHYSAYTPDISCRISPLPSFST